MLDIITYTYPYVKSGSKTTDSLPAIDAARPRRLMQDDLIQPRQLRCQLFPEPARHQFNRRIFQARDVVQVGVIELLHDGTHHVLNRGVIVENPTGLVHRTPHGNGNLETVTVDISAFVSGRKLRQRLGRLKLEIFGEDNDHGGSSDHSSKNPLLSSLTGRWQRSGNLPQKNASFAGIARFTF